MRGRGAALRARDAGAAVSSAWDGASIAESGLSVSIVERLEAEGVFTLTDWAALTPRERRSIWGITRRMVAELDALAKGTA